MASLRRGVFGKRGKRLEGILELNDKDFERVIRDRELALVDFWAEWCAPCMLLEPIMEELHDRYGGKVAFYRLNVDESPMTASRYRVMSLPTLMLFRRGVPIGMLVGAMPKERIEEWLKGHL